MITIMYLIICWLSNSIAVDINLTAILAILDISWMIAGVIVKKK